MMLGLGILLNRETVMATAMMRSAAMKTMLNPAVMKSTRMRMWSKWKHTTIRRKRKRMFHRWKQTKKRKLKRNHGYCYGSLVWIFEF